MTSIQRCRDTRIIVWKRGFIVLEARLQRGFRQKIMEILVSMSGLNMERVSFLPGVIVGNNDVYCSPIPRDGETGA